MKREQLIKKIETVVKKNSKKGILTTTKFVGTYNYKSGYDTYIAVSYDETGNIVVYSYYQNDRNEHIDTYTTKLSELPDKELEAVFKTLGTDDDDINHYVAWENLEEKNVEILTTLGMYKPVKKAAKFIDIDNIPELGNDKDAYWIDRDENVGVLRFKGCAPSGHEIYEVEGKNIVDHPYDMDDKVRLFHWTDKYRANKGAFMVVDGDDTSDYDFIYVPTKEQLLDIAEKERAVKQYFFVENDLSTWKRYKIQDPRKNPKDGVAVFDNKKEAVEHFNMLKEQFKTKFTNLLSRLEKCKNSIIEAVMTDEVVDADKCTIEAKDAVIGKKYYQCNLWGEIRVKEPFTVIARDENSGILTLDNGCILAPNYHVMELENGAKVIEKEKHKSVIQYIDALEGHEYTTKRILEMLETCVPFTRDCSIPTGCYDNAVKSIELKSTMLKCVKKTVKAQ